MDGQSPIGEYGDVRCDFAAGWQVPDGRQIFWVCRDEGQAGPNYPALFSLYGVGRAAAGRRQDGPQCRGRQLLLPARGAEARPGLLN